MQHRDLSICYVAFVFSVNLLYACIDDAVSRYAFTVLTSFSCKLANDDYIDMKLESFQRNLNLHYLEP